MEPKYPNRFKPGGCQGKHKIGISPEGLYECVGCAMSYTIPAIKRYLRESYPDHWHILWYYLRIMRRRASNKLRRKRRLF